MNDSILGQHGDGYVQANGLRLHYEQWGDGPQAVVALHGTSLHGAVWDWLAEALPRRWRLIGLDQRSHGDSQRAQPGQYGVEHYCADLEAFADRLGLERFSIVGSSLGSRVALLYAARHPDRVQSLGLLDLSFEMPTSASEHMVHAHVTRPRTFANFDEAMAFSRTLPQRLRFTDAVHRRTLQGDLRPRADGRLEWRYDKEAAIETLRSAARDMWDSVRAVQAPTVILRGAESDVLVPSTVERLKREFRGVKIVDVPNSGHSIWGDNPTFTADALVQALEASVSVHAEPVEALPPASTSSARTVGGASTSSARTVGGASTGSARTVGGASTGSTRTVGGASTGSARTGMARGERFTVTARGLRFSGLQWGAPKSPVLLCLHGTSMQASAWTALGNALQDGWRVVALDMRGHGHSDQPPTGYSLGDYAEDIPAVLDALGVEKASVVGSSLGTQVAIEFAARWPDLCDKLVLSDPSCMIAQDPIDRYVALHRERPRRFANMDEALAFSRGMPQRRRFSDEVHRYTLEGDLRPTADGQLEWCYGLEPILMTFRSLKVDQAASIRAVRAPVLILRGQESHVLSRADALKLQGMFPHVELIEIGDSGHTIWGDQPGALARETRAFLRAA